MTEKRVQKRLHFVLWDEQRIPLLREAHRLLVERTGSRDIPFLPAIFCTLDQAVCIAEELRRERSLV